MKPYDESLVGRRIQFSTPDGAVNGTIAWGEFSDGKFIGYTVECEPPCDGFWGSVLESGDGKFSAGVLTLS